MKKQLKIKLWEALYSVLPVTFIVLLLSFTFTPMPFYSIVLFLIGALLLIIGMTFFTLGADISMMNIGEKMGSYLTKSRKLSLVIVTTLFIGAFITIAEPDLKVLASQTPAVPDAVLINAVAIGVGIFLVISFLRILFQIKLSHILIGLYLLVFLLAIFTHENFLAVAFDSGGVTTGPITVPFIMALGIGLASVRGDKTTEEDSFGLVALCSVGPIITVLILGMFYNSSSGSYNPISVPTLDRFSEIFLLFLSNLPHFAWEVVIALLPIIVMFIIFQVFALRISRRPLLKIVVGVVYTFLGLVLFLTGVNVGFMPAGHYIGIKLASGSYRWSLLPLGMLIGFFIVAAEPAVHVLKQQVEEITEGNISGRAMGISLSIGVAVSVGLAMLRVLFGISIWYMIIPGYAIALLLTFFVPPLFTAIAFDSGGVASGPMTATFLLPFAMGASEGVGGNILTDAFGIVAMVAMTPLITIQCLGLVYRIKTSKLSSKEPLPLIDETIIDYDEENDQASQSEEHKQNEITEGNEEKSLISHIDIEYNRGNIVEDDLSYGQEG
ncbi:MAG: DUF1538 domain-containing protein [Clostridiales bacterium]|nr:DUF1538 domain-containing protein [Clostridiales bacterium]